MVVDSYSLTLCPSAYHSQSPAVQKRHPKLTIMPFLSIIIPVYNKEQYLNKCIQSIVDQNFTDWEMILIDDGSSDSSPDICDRWSKQDSRISFFHQQNTGVSSARNNGLRQAKGEYIQFTDADDWWDSNFLCNLHQEVINYSEPDILIYGLTKITNTGFKTKVRPTKRGKVEKEEFISNLISEQASSGIYGCVANKLISRDFIINNQLKFNESYKLMEDYDFFLSAYEKAENIALSHLTGYLYLQEAENSSTSSNFIHNRLDNIKILIKSYHIRVAFCGSSETDFHIVSKQVIGQVIASFMELHYPSYNSVKTLNTELMGLLKEFPMTKLEVSGLSSHIIKFLLTIKNYYLLALYLKSKQYISKIN